MRIRELGIHNVLHFDEFRLDFRQTNAGLHIIYGPNEAGKSTILRVLVDLLFGGKIDDEFKDGYDSKSRIEGVLEGGRQSGIREIAAGKASLTGDSRDHSPVLPGPLELAIARKRKYSSLVLTDDTQAELPDDLVLSLLGGLDKERYTLLFGFNHDRLRMGGDSLLESGGHAGISLFEAGGGIQFLQKILADLSSKTEDLLDSSFRSNSKKRLNTAWRSYKELKDNARRSSLRGEDWHRQKHEIEAKQALILSIEVEMDKLDAKVKQLQRILRTRPYRAEHKSTQSRLDTLADSTLLTLEQDAKIADDVNGLEKVETEIYRKEQDLADEKRTLEGIFVNRAVLDAKDPINNLNRRIEQYVEASQAVPRLKQQILTEESRARDMVHDLAPTQDLANVEQLRVPAKDDLEIRQLAALWTDLARELKQVSDQVLELDEDIRHREDQLKQTGERVDLSELRQVMEEAGRSGDVESTLTQLRRDITAKYQAARRHLVTQAVWNGSLEELTRLAVPLTETVARHANQFSETEQAIADLERDIAKQLKDLEAIREQIAVLELSGRVPSEADLAAARAHRNHGWQLVRMSWLGETGAAAAKSGNDERYASSDLSLEEAVGAYAKDQDLPLVFEEAMSEADGVADWMRRESDRSARLSQYQLQEERTESTLARLRSELNQARETYEGLQVKWESEWSGAGITPKSPVEMKAWLAEYYRPLTKEMGEVQDLEDRARELEKLRDSLKDRLTLLYDSAGRTLVPSFTAGTFESLRSLVSAVTNWMNEIDSQEKLRQTLFEQCGELKAKRDRQAALGRRKKEEFAAAKERWTRFAQTYAFLPETPHAAVGYLDKLRELFTVVREISRLEDSLQNEAAVCTSFEDATRELAEQVGQTIEDDTSYSAFVLQMAAALTEAHQADRERLLLEQQMAKLTLDLERLKADWENLTAVVAGYKEKYQCPDDEDLRDLVEKSREQKVLAEQLNQIETNMRRAGDGLSVEELILEVESGPEVDALQSIADAALESFNREKQRRDDERQALWQLKQQFEEMNEDKSDAADYVQQAEFALAEVDRSWNEYLRFELARRLLQRAVEEFRAQNESTVILRAGDLFRELTLGHYTELTVEYDGVTPVLEAITENKERRRVSQMSDGTRDQLYLALRLAFVEQHVDSTESVPLIMDDILVHFDDARTRATLDVLCQLAQKTQILYFTHHQSIVESAASLSGSQPNRVQIHELSGQMG